MKSEWQNCPLLEENATAQSVENWGRNIKTKQSPNPSISHQPCSCSSPPICKPTTGGAGFAPRQSYNRCYLVHIWTKVRKKKNHIYPQILPEDFSFHSRNFLGWVRTTQTRHKLRHVQVLPSCYQSIRFAEQKTLLQDTHTHKKA